MTIYSPRPSISSPRSSTARFHSYAKAAAQQQMFTARKHRQLYWVEAAG